MVNTIYLRARLLFCLQVKPKGKCMKLAVSQIAWQPPQEGQALALLAAQGFAGLEIAPPRLAGASPYLQPGKAAAFAKQLKARHGLHICSMQSIWYGQSGSMFGRQAQQLLEYTKAAILFAKAAGCKNLVFGCPKNRCLPAGKSPDDALDFFRQLGNFAQLHGRVLALEACPAIYGTNFMNTTAQALEMLAKVNNPGVMLNLDYGAILANGEDVEMLRGQVKYISHVHISQPGLAPIQPHKGHVALAALLRQEGYGGYVSIEMLPSVLPVAASAEKHGAPACAAHTVPVVADKEEMPLGQNIASPLAALESAVKYLREVFA